MGGRDYAPALALLVISVVLFIVYFSIQHHTRDTDIVLFPAFASLFGAIVYAWQMRVCYHGKGMGCFMF